MFGRIKIYLDEMFPVSYFIGTVIYTLVVLLTFAKISNVELQFHMAYVGVAIGLISLILLIRIMDEFKDYQDDLTNYPDRPLPSGRVLKSDLMVLGAVGVGIGTLTSMVTKESFLWYMISLAFSYLMLKWFFIENKMRKSLPLALVSHHPIVFIYLVYIGETFRALNGIEGLSMYWIIVPIGLASTNWEFSRKLRSPEEETEYTTYSKIWGPRTAASVAIATQIAVIAGLNFFFSKVDVSGTFIAIANAVLFISMLPYIKFISSLKHKRHMKEYAERITLAVQVLLLVAYFL